MSVAARSIGEALVAVAGRERVRDDAAALDAATVDGLRPRWVARPASLDELSPILVVASDSRLAVVPRGSGSSLELGHPPSRLDLVLDLAGLDQVIESNPDDLTITVRRGSPPARSPRGWRRTGSGWPSIRPALRREPSA